MHSLASASQRPPLPSTAADTAAALLGSCQRRLARPRGPSEEMEPLWEPDPPAESQTERGRERDLVLHRAKKERRHQELLALALRVKLGTTGALLWKPLKLLPFPQITSPLVKRTALRDGERQCSYEKAHNFKVSHGSLDFALSGVKLWVCQCRVLTIQYMQSHCVLNAF